LPAAWNIFAYLRSEKLKAVSFRWSKGATLFHNEFERNTEGARQKHIFAQGVTITL